MTHTDDRLPPLRDVITKHQLRAIKALGQNFLLDLNLTRKIARAASQLDETTVLEVGPGPGGLTRALLMEGAAEVVAIERDPRCLAALKEIAAAYPDRLHALQGDALEIDEKVIVGTGRPVQIVSNLPYNVGTALLIKWLTLPDWPPWWTRATLLFQKEVAERLIAIPRSSAYGRLSILAHWRTDVRILFDIPPSAFTPPPKVVSSLVQITPLSEPRFQASLSHLERVTAAAFGQRRKMLRSALKSLGTDPAPLLEDANLDPTARAEEIGLDGFCALARAYGGRNEAPPQPHIPFVS